MNKTVIIIISIILFSGISNTDAGISIYLTSTTIKTSDIRVPLYNKLNTSWPISGNITPDFPISSSFGPRQLVSEDYRFDFHRGIDISQPIGTPIYAISDGIVSHAGPHDSFSDPMIRLRHNVNETEFGFDEYYSMYLHINETEVVENENVSKGQLIGYTGAASKNNYEHLHFEIREGNLFSPNSTHPLEYLPSPDNGAPEVSLIPNKPLFQGGIIYVRINVSSSELDLIDFGITGEIDEQSIDIRYQLNQINHETMNKSKLDNEIFVKNDGKIIIKPKFHNSDFKYMIYNITINLQDIIGTQEPNNIDIRIFASDIHQNRRLVRLTSEAHGEISSIISNPSGEQQANLSFETFMMTMIIITYGSRSKFQKINDFKNRVD